MRLTLDVSKAHRRVLINPADQIRACCAFMWVMTCINVSLSILVLVSVGGIGDV